MLVREDRHLFKRELEQLNTLTGQVTLLNSNARWLIMELYKVSLSCGHACEG